MVSTRVYQLDLEVWIMKANSDVNVLKIGAGFFGLIFTLVFVLGLTALFISLPAAADQGGNRSVPAFHAIEGSGFETREFLPGAGYRCMDPVKGPRAAGKRS